MNSIDCFEVFCYLILCVLGAARKHTRYSTNLWSEITMDLYFGTYQSFSTVSKKDAAILLGADNLVGDIYEIEIEIDEECHKAWLVNRFNQRIGYFEPDFSRKLSIFKARDFAIKAILSFVAYTDRPDPGHYWGEMAVICYDSSRADIFERYIASISDAMAEGKRPDVSLSINDVDRILDSKGAWTPDGQVPLPKKAKGTAIMKSKRSLNEKLIEQGRKGNIGCYIVSWAFLLGLVALLIFGLKSCGVF